MSPLCPFVVSRGLCPFVVSRGLCPFVVSPMPVRGEALVRHPGGPPMYSRFTTQFALPMSFLYVSRAA